MTSEQAERVSVIDPISPAIDRVKLMLFKPFELRRWFVIGFCAWLAFLGSGGPGGGPGGGGGGPRYNVPSRPHEQQAQVREAIDAAKEFLVGNLYWLVPVVVIVVVLIVGFGLLIAWLNSRGKFMFLHCVATNKAQVKVPWRKFGKQGNSLFLFRIVLGIIGFFVIGLPVLGIILLVVMMIAGDGPTATVASISGIAVLGLIIFVLSIVLFLVKKFTLDFVVPVMFLRMTNCVAGWREFMTILSTNKLRFTLYLLFQLVIGLTIAMLILAGTCITCCCLACILAIPYIGTVIVLPLLVFKRAYSLYYLQQFGPEFDVFTTESLEAEPA